LDSKLLYSTKVSEIIDYIFHKKQDAFSNFQKIQQRSNATSHWVQTEIILETDQKKRSKIVEKFIDVCQHLMNLNNEMGVMEILMGLEAPAINRLTITFGDIPQKQIRTWDLLKKKIEQGIFSKEIDNPKYVPSFEKLFFLLEKIDETPETLTSGLINMGRLQLIYTLLKPFLNFSKKISHNLQPIPVIQEYLEKTDILDDKILLQGSMHLEAPPNSTFEQNDKIKEIINKRRKLKRIEKTKTTRKNQRPEETKVMDALELHKGQLNTTYKYAKEQVEKVFTELKETPSVANRTKVLDVSLKELKDIYTTINTELVEFSETLIPKPEEALGFLILTDPDQIPSDLYLPTTYEWLWNNDKGGFSPFDTKTTLIIELAWNENNTGHCKLTHGYFGKSPDGYIIDFQNMEQINVQTNFGRRVQRRKASYIKESDHRSNVFALELEISKLQEQLKTIEEAQKKPKPTTRGIKLF